MHVSGILCYCLKASSTGDWECFGLALNLGMRFCQGFYSAACLDPIWASNSQLEHCLLCPFLKTLTKQAKGKSLVKFLFMMYLLQNKDKRNPEVTAVFEPEKALLTTVFSGLFGFEVHSHQNMYFLDYSHSL